MSFRVFWFRHEAELTRCKAVESILDSKPGANFADCGRHGVGASLNRNSRWESRLNC